MVKMYEICEGTFVPEECCTFHEPPEGGGHGLSVSGNDIAHLLDALINFVPRNMADFVQDKASVQSKDFVWAYIAGLSECSLLEISFQEGDGIAVPYILGSNLQHDIIIALDARKYQGRPPFGMAQVGKWEREDDNIAFYKSSHAESSSSLSQSFAKPGSLNSVLLASPSSRRTNLTKARIVSSLLSGAWDIRSWIICCVDMALHLLVKNGYCIGDIITQIGGNGQGMRKKLKEARQGAGMTQQQMADKLGINLRHYQKIEYGEIGGSFDAWNALEDMLGIHQRILREIEDSHLALKGNRQGH